MSVRVYSTSFNWAFARMGKGDWYACFCKKLPRYRLIGIGRFIIATDARRFIQDITEIIERKRTKQ